MSTGHGPDVFVKRRVYTFRWIHPSLRRHRRKRNARESKRQAIEARQVARAVVIVNRAPTLIHRGKAAR